MSLRCPLTLCRLTLPVRARSCEHLDAFDLHAFLSITKGSHRWSCPKCRKNAPFNDLYIDKKLLNIIKRAPAGCDAVLFTDDGKWKPVLDGDNRQKQKKKVDIKEKDSITILSDEEESTKA